MCTRTCIFKFKIILIIIIFKTLICVFKDFQKCNDIKMPHYVQDLVGHYCSTLNLGA